MTGLHQWSAVTAYIPCTVHVFYRSHTVTVHRPNARLHWLKAGPAKQNPAWLVN